MLYATDSNAAANRSHPDLPIDPPALDAKPALACMVFLEGMALHTWWRHRAEARQIEIRIMDNDPEFRVSLSHDPVPAPAGRALPIIHGHDAKAFNSIPAAPALQLSLDSKERQTTLQLCSQQLISRNSGSARARAAQSEFLCR